MARDRSVVTGKFSPVNDKLTGAQVVDSKRGKKWRITAELPRHEGKRNRKYRDVYGSERAARRAMHEFVMELNQNLVTSGISNRIDIDSNMTFGEMMEEWLEANRNKEKPKRLTWEKYVGMARNHIKPCLGHIKLRDMAPYHLYQYQEIKLGEGQKIGGGKLCANTVKKHLSLISNVLGRAVKKGLIRDNPSKLIDREGGNSSPAVAVNCFRVEELSDLLAKLESLYALRRAGKKVKNRPETIEKLKGLGFTEEEIKSPKALHKLKVTQLYPIVYLGAATGMRLSELLALQWENVDLRTGKIKVYESSHYGTKKDGEESGHHINPTKEGHVKSDIDLSPGDIEFLKSHHLEQRVKKMRYVGSYTDRGLVFARNDGSHLRNDTVCRVFTGFARSINYTQTFHALRHTHITILIAAGVPPVYIARRAGHLKPSTTTDWYSHAEKTAIPNLGLIYHDSLTKVVQGSSEHNINCEVIRGTG